MPTIQELKELLREKDVSVQENLKKADLERLYNSVSSSDKINFPKDQEKNLLFKSIKRDIKIDWHLHLSNYGWTTTRAITSERADQLKEDLFTWIKRHNLESLEGASHGVLHIHPIGHTEFMWKARKECKHVFESFFETSNLLTSFDTACVLYPSARESKQWFHLDQGNKYLDFSGVQGILALTPHYEEDAGTLLIEGSQRYFSEYFKKYPAEGFGLGVQRVSAEDEIFSNCRIIKPILEKGEILLFDSRVVHCNTNIKINKSYPRTCLYISMLPKEFCPSEELVKRKKCYKDGTSTNHWCYGEYFNTKPRSSRFANMNHIPVEIFPLDKEMQDLAF